MRKPWLVLLLLAACADEEAGAPKDFVLVPAANLKRIVITSEGGAFAFRTADASSVVMLASSQDLDVSQNTGTLRVKAPKDIEVEVTAPPGFDLVANLKQGDIVLEGKWGVINLDAAKGNIRVDGEEVAGGEVDALKGHVEFTTKAVPATNLKCAAASGDVTATIPSRYRGAVQLASAEGQIDLRAHPRLRVRRERTGKSVLAFVGKRFTAEENAELGVDKRPGIWITARGKATFRLAD